MTLTVVMKVVCFPLVVLRRWKWHLLHTLHALPCLHDIQYRRTSMYNASACLCILAMHEDEWPNQPAEPSQRVCRCWRGGVAA